MQDSTFDLPQVLAMAAAFGFVSGIRLYGLLFVVGLAVAFNWIPLPSSLHVLSHPLVLTGLGILSFIEFFADKFPWLDSAWDAIHTFIRLPAGAALAVALAGGQSDAVHVLLGLEGGTFAATSHFAKAGTRAALNTSPEPFSNIAWSLGEDVTAAGLTWLVAVHPLAAGAVAVAGVVLCLWMLRAMWRGVHAIVERARNLTSPKSIQ